MHAKNPPLHTRTGTCGHTHMHTHRHTHTLHLLLNSSFSGWQRSAGQSGQSHPGCQSSCSLQTVASPNGQRINTCCQCGIVQTISYRLGKKEGAVAKHGKRIKCNCWCYWVCPSSGLLKEVIGEGSFVALSSWNPYKVWRMKEGGKKLILCLTDMRKTEMASFSTVKLASEKQARGRVRIWKGEEWDRAVNWGLLVFPVPFYSRGSCGNTQLGRANGCC